MLLDLRKFFVPFPPLHSSCITQDFLTSHILKSKNIVYLNSFNIIIWLFSSFNIQNIQFLSHPLAQVSTNHTRNGNAFSLSRVVLSSFYLTAPLQHFQLEMCAVASCSKKLAIFPYSHSNSVLVSQRSVFLWTLKSMSV